MRTPLSATLPAIIVMTIVVGTVPFVRGASFPDVRSGDAYAPSVELLESEGIVEGYADGTYRPTERMNRAEYLKVLTRAALGRNAISADAGCFADFYGAEQWYWRYACAAKERGVVHGYPDGTFRGDRWANQAEAVKMAVLMFNVPLPVYFRAPDNWYDPYMDAAASMGVFTSLRQDPSRLMTRADMALVVAAFLEINGGGSVGLCDGYAVGETYPSPDGCNTCTCTINGSACTKRACLPTEPSGDKCLSSNDCRFNEYCTVEDGDCYSACEPGDQYCIQACAGFCRVRSGSTGSCAVRKDAIDRRFEDNRACQTNADCAVFIHGCSPYLTCGKPVRKDAVSSLEREVSEFAEDCREEPMQCAACLQQQAICSAGRCVLQ